MKTSVVIGRFQIPQLHEGHISLLKTAYASSDKLLVILAVTEDSPSLKNPYSPDARKRMIHQCVSEYEFKITTFATIKDYYSDHVWSHHLDIIIDSLTFDSEVKIYHSRDSIAGHYFGKYPLVAVKSKSKLSSTEIRDKVINSNISLYNTTDREVYLRGLSDGIKHANKLLAREYQWIHQI